MNEEDVENLKWLKVFKYVSIVLSCLHWSISLSYNVYNFVHYSSCSKYDLYSKSKVLVDVEKVKPYYLSLIEKVGTFILFCRCCCLYIWGSYFLLIWPLALQYFPAKLRWWWWTMWDQRRFTKWCWMRLRIINHKFHHPYHLKGLSNSDISFN